MDKGREVIPLTHEQLAVVAISKRTHAEKAKSSRAAWYLKIPGERINFLVARRTPPGPFIAYLAIWQQAKLDRNDHVVVRPKTLDLFGISQRRFGRYVATLESLGLIRVTRAPGRKIRIFLRDPLRIDDPNI